MSVERACDFIKGFEGCRLAAYQDCVGVWTIGFGTTGEVKSGQTCTQEQADAWLKERVEQIQHEIHGMVSVPLTDGQMAALTSFCYNLGCASLKRSTLLKKINAKDPSAAEEFLRWDLAGGRQVAGLTRRRQAERTLFQSPC